MAITVKIEEVFNVTLEFEARGAKLYVQLANSVRNPGVKQIFAYLAKQETEHRDRFQAMGDEFRKRGLLKSTTTEHMSYLVNFLNRKMFAKDILAQKVSSVRDLESVIDFAITFELDSILFYNEMKSIVDMEQHHLLEEIIEEERRHFVQLLKLRNAEDKSSMLASGLQ